jgi:hypothetical protein
MGKNFKVNKTVLNFIHARDYFPPQDAENYRYAVQDLKFDPMAYGKEIQNFNMILPETDMLLGEMLGENFAKVDEDRSGTFRYPWNNLIHFEEYDSLREWRLAVALEDTVFRTYSHSLGFKTVLDCKNEEWKTLNYVNEEEWNLETQINLRENDSVFYRPWVFHSFENKLIHCYTIMIDE